MKAGFSFRSGSPFGIALLVLELPCLFNCPVSSIVDMADVGLELAAMTGLTLTHLPYSTRNTPLVCGFKFP